MKNKKWYSKLLKRVNLSTTYEIFNLFKSSKFVVLKQEEYKNHLYREIAFILGPYILCFAKNKTMKNDLVLDWANRNPHIPFGKIFKNRKTKRKIIKKTPHSRKYIVSGEINATIEEKFQGLGVLKVSAFCGKVINSRKDIDISKTFISKSNSDFYLFPESYPFSRMDFSPNEFPEGTIFGKYGRQGPETYFMKKTPIQINKSTAFANEKKIMKKGIFPKIINHKGIKVAVIICYDLLNPRISYYLANQDIDIVFIPAMIPFNDVNKWKKFLYVRGQEIQCPLILASNKDKRNICIPKILYYDPIEEKVNEYNKPQIFEIPFGKLKIKESPKVHWSWLLKNKVFGPFSKDFN
jgi:hypothetical protein